MLLLAVRCGFSYAVRCLFLGLCVDVFCLSFVVCCCLIMPLLFVVRWLRLLFGVC